MCLQYQLVKWSSSQICCLLVFVFQHSSRLWLFVTIWIQPMSISGNMFKLAIERTYICQSDITLNIWQILSINMVITSNYEHIHRNYQGNDLDSIHICKPLKFKYIIAVMLLAKYLTCGIRQEITMKDKCLLKTTNLPDYVIEMLHLLWAY